MRVAQVDAGGAERTPQALGTTTGDKMFHTGSENGFRLNPSKRNTRSVERAATADEAQDDKGDADNEGSSGAGESAEPMNEDDDEESNGQVALDAPDNGGTMDQTPMTSTD